MSKLKWDVVGERTYQTGIDHVVLYPYGDEGYNKGVAWSGVTGITESPSGAEASKTYADNINYLTLMSAEELGLTIEALTYPTEFEECDGTREIAPGITVGQQNRTKFGLAYRNIVGNDTKLNDYGYKITLVYGCLASPSEKSHSTVNDSPEAGTFSWEVSTTPVDVPAIDGKVFKPTASIVIDSTKVSAEQLAAIEKVLYGVDADSEHSVDAAEAHLPLPEELVKIFKAATTEGKSSTSSADDQHTADAAG